MSVGVHVEVRRAHLADSTRKWTYDCGLLGGYMTELERSHRDYYSTQRGLSFYCQELNLLRPKRLNVQTILH